LFVRINLVAVAVAAAGLFLPRVTAGGYDPAIVRTGYDAVFGLLLVLVCAALGGWYATRADWLTAALLFVVWLGLLATAAFEIVRVSATYSGQVGLADVGLGLYCNALGAAVGASAGAIEAVRQWSPGRPRAGSGRWLPWFAAVAAAVVTLAAVGVTGQLAGRDAQVRSAAAVSGPQSGFALGTPTRDQSPVEGHHVVTAPGSSTTTPGAGQQVGPSVSAATPSTLGTTGTGVSPSGDSGNSGAWGMDGGLASYWPGYTGTDGSFYIWPGYLGPATNTGVTGDSGSTVTGATGLAGSGVASSTGAGPTGSTGAGTTTTTSVPPASSAPPAVSGGNRTV
jgi:hypothetical protein